MRLSNAVIFKSLDNLSSTPFSSFRPWYVLTLPTSRSCQRVFQLAYGLEYRTISARDHRTPALPSFLEDSAPSPEPALVTLSCASSHNRATGSSSSSSKKRLSTGLGNLILVICVLHQAELVTEDATDDDFHRSIPLRPNVKSADLRRFAEFVHHQEILRHAHAIETSSLLLVAASTNPPPVTQPLPPAALASRT